MRPVREFMDRLVFFEVTPQTVRSHAKGAPTGRTIYRF
jgi:hypothetical protein